METAFHGSPFACVSCPGRGPFARCYSSLQNAAGKRVPSKQFCQSQPPQHLVAVSLEVYRSSPAAAADSRGLSAVWQQPACSLLGSLLVLQAAPAFAAGPQDLASSLQSSTALASLLGSSLEDDDADPWTLYGVSRKKYAIEQRDGEKIVSRRKGFTVDTCTSGIAANQETPTFQGASTSEKLSMMDWQTCSHAEAPDLKQACVQSCAAACAEGIREYENQSLRASGLHMSVADRNRLQRSCNRQCPYQCNKPGQQYGFVIPFRR